MTTTNKLSKFLAQSGHCSRRTATQLIKSGVVKVNGKVVLEPFYPLNADDSVKVNNKRILPEQKLYFLFNKPKDVICTLSDTKERNTIADFFKNIPERLYPIGRLDRNTTGLIVMTNDGQLTQKLAHPKFNISKTYQVTTHKPVTQEHLDRLIKGIKLEDGFMKVDSAKYASSHSANVILLTIHSGKKHIIKRLFKELRYFVEKLDRINFAGLTKKGLPVGHYRSLTQKEIEKLKKDFSEEKKPIVKK
ncbi:MAG TPA: pseudouridine synthase [Candidatus Saccharimonadales bacterium]|nr:pseudouridine synthase [Candidatus Saccharimonadales bacterium]